MQELGLRKLLIVVINLLFVMTVAFGKDSAGMLLRTCMSLRCVMHARLMPSQIHISMRIIDMHCNVNGLGYLWAICALAS